MVRGGSVSRLRLLSNRPWWMRESSQARNLALGNGLEIKPGIRAHFEGHSTVTWRTNRKGLRNRPRWILRISFRRYALDTHAVHGIFCFSFQKKAAF